MVFTNFVYFFCKAFGCVFFCNTFFFHTIKSVDARYSSRVERLLYALGAGWQGRVNCELQHQSHSPCIGTLSFLRPDTTAHQTCAGLRYIKCILFVGCIMSMLYSPIVSYMFRIIKSEEYYYFSCCI